MHFTIINMGIKPHFLFYLIIQKNFTFSFFYFSKTFNHKIYLIKLCDRFSIFLVFIYKYIFVYVKPFLFYSIAQKFKNFLIVQLCEELKKKQVQQAICTVFNHLFRFFEILAKRLLRNFTSFFVLRKDNQLKSRPICKSLTLMAVALALANSLSLSIHPLPSTKTISGMERILVGLTSLNKEF